MRPDALHLAHEHVPGTGPVTLESVAAADPMTGGVLAGGHVNDTYRASRDGRWFALRLATAGGAVLGLDREWECRVLRSAAAAGLAPEVLRCAPRQGVLVMRWEEGGHWTGDAARQLPELARIGHLVRRIQALPVPANPLRMSIERWIDHYHGISARAGGGRLQERPLLAELTDALAQHLAALARLPPAEPVLCHGDLHAGNLLAAGHVLRLVDWEYAHLAEPFWDLAGWSSNHDLGAAQSRALLVAYLARPAGREDEVRIELLVWLYDYLCLLWSELALAVAGGCAEPALAARARVLIARLRPPASGRRGQF